MAHRTMWLSAKPRIAGMTLVELVATMGILGIVTALALPSFRGLSVRQSLRISQQRIAAMLYRTQQLTLAPEASPVEGYDIVGYGLLFHRGGQPVTLGTCHFTPANDFVAIMKFTRAQEGNAPIRATLLSDPLGAAPCEVRTGNNADSFYTLPRDVIFSVAKSSPPLSESWLFRLPVAAAAAQYGTLSYATDTTFDPLIDGSATLVLQHRTARIYNARLEKTQALCRSLTFSRTSTAISSSVGIDEICVEES